MKAAAISALAGSVWIAAQSVDFSNTINTGAIIVGLLIVAVAGIFTVRANTAGIWKNNYEGEKEAHDRCKEKCEELSGKLLEERELQQKLRHDLKNEIASLRLKTDLTIHEAAESARHSEMVLVLGSMQEAMQEMASGMRELTKEVVSNGTSSQS